MEWRRMVPPGWYVAFLGGFAMIMIGVGLLGELATQGDATAAAALTAILGVIAAWLAALARRRQLAGGA